MSYANVVMLLPARTDTKWFHKYIYNNPKCEIRFIKGRLKFGNSKNSAPFPSMIVIFDNMILRPQCKYCEDRIICAGECEKTM